MGNRNELKEVLVFKGLFLKAGIVNGCPHYSSQFSWKGLSTSILQSVLGD